MTEASLLAVDAGQSGIRCRVVVDGVVTDEFDRSGVRTDLRVLPQMAECAAMAAERGHAPGTMALGVSGLVEDDHATELLDLVAPYGVSQVHMAHDSVSSYLGALGADPGCICATGTGTVTLAVGERSTARVDGWGWSMGDLGSGFWIGQEGLRAGMRAHDGRGPATGMLAAIARDFTSIEGAYVELQADDLRIARIASYAREVLELAAAGDQPCLDVAVRAGQALAEAVAAGLRRVDHLHEPAVCGMGGIFRSELLSQAFDEQLQALVPGARCVQPLGTSLDGAQLLPTLGDDHPLVSSFERAARG